MSAKVNPKKCTACEACLDICPAQAIHMEDSFAIVDINLCVDCGACIEVCPSEAIELNLKDGFSHSSCFPEKDDNEINCEEELEKQDKEEEKND